VTWCDDEPEPVPAQAASGLVPVASAPRVLIAEPSYSFREWLIAAMAPMRPVVMEAMDGWSLLWCLAESQVDLVVARNDMPGLSGVQVLSAMRSAGFDTPFVLVGSRDSDRVRAVLARVGRATVVDDPSDPGALREACRSSLEAGSEDNHIEVSARRIHEQERERTRS
jgi:DNA-binding response OmpR family regulator